MTLQLTPAQEQRLEKVAAATLQSTDEVAQNALEAFLDDHEELLAAVNEDDEEFARGEFVSHEEVIAHFAKRFSK